MLDKLDVFEARVRERAFELWQQAGCPENSAEEFWHRAHTIEMQEFDLSKQDLERVKNETSATHDAEDFA